MLRKVRIQNFKSLKDVTLELQKVNLLIGPNNSGKSNFLKGLEFVSKRLKEYYEDDKNTFTFMHHEEEIKVTLIKQIIDKDNLVLFDVFKYNHNGLKSTGELGRTTTDDVNALEKFQGNVRYSFDKDGFFFSNNSSKEEWFTIFGNELTNTILYSIIPNPLTKPYPILADNKIIISDTSNLVTFIDAMKDEFPEVIQAINKDLNKCIPEFSEIRLSSVSLDENDNLRKLYGDKTFKKLGLYNSSKKVTFWADEVSEGVLYFLALLCIIHQPNPPKLLLLEEPEKGIHPRRIREVIDFIFQLVEEKDIQVIMTTHSERVLDEFEDIPESVFVFDKDEEGATQVKNLLKDIIEPSNIKMESLGLPRIKFTESLGSHWVTGFIGGVPK